MTVSKTTDFNRSYGTVVLRGGRLTKWKGQAASLSLSLGQLIASVSPVALGRALMVGASKTATAAVLGGAGLIVTTTGVSADCSPEEGATGGYICSGEITEKQTLQDRVNADRPLKVTISEEGTTVDTSGTTGHDAFTLDSKAEITFEDKTTAGATITGADNGIYAQNNGTGALSITTTGTTTGTSEDGIFARNGSQKAPAGTSLTINAAETEGGDGYGIYARNFGDGALSITTTGDTTGETKGGIYAKNSGTSLTINAAETKGGEYGI